MLLLTGVLALAVLTSCDETTEVVPAETAATEPSASGYSDEVSPTNAQPTFDNLPSPAAGYEWYVYPQSEFDLPRYAVEIPTNWRAAYPGESNPQVFIPVDIEDIGAGQSILAYSSLAQPTPNNFTFLLPGQGGSCGILPGTESTAVNRTWDIIELRCPIFDSGRCTADPRDAVIDCESTSPDGRLETLSGVAAETTIGKFTFTFILRDPEKASPENPALQRILDSLVVEANPE